MGTAHKLVTGCVLVQMITPAIYAKHHLHPLTAQQHNIGAGEAVNLVKMEELPPEDNRQLVLARDIGPEQIVPRVV